MLSILRLGDIATCGHVPITGSPNVFANDLNVTRAYEDILNCPVPPPFVRYLEGLHTVFVNDLPLVHIGDLNMHGGVAVDGSPDVFGDDFSFGSTGKPPDPLGVAIIEGPGEGNTDFINSFQPGVDRVTAAQYMADDTNVDGPNTGSDPVNRTVQRYEERAVGTTEKIEKVVATAPPPTGVPPPTVSPNCQEIIDKGEDFDFYDPPFQLSPNFTLAQVSRNTLVSKYDVKAQVGLSKVDIICNLRTLCYNVLEPMLARYGSTMRVNSGFRTGRGTSQHYRGEAVDISFTDTPNADASFARAQEITNLFNYDQYIYEQNNSIWHHVSYKASGSLRRNILTKPRGNKYLQGLHKVAF